MQSQLLPRVYGRNAFGKQQGRSRQPKRSQNAVVASSAVSSTPQAFNEATLDEYSPDESLYRPIRSQMEIHSLRNIFGMIEDGDLNLQPKYQRDYVWDDYKACRLIETVFTGLYIPSVTWHEKESGRFDVVDGRQRLSTLYYFHKGHWPGNEKKPFVITGTSIQHLNGKSWKELPHEGEVSQRMFLKFALQVSKLLQGTSEEAVFKTYENLNSGSVELTPHQIRKVMYSGPYLELLDELAGHELVLTARHAERKSKEEEDRELVLRFFALRRSGIAGFKGPFKDFLNKEMSERKGVTEKELGDMKKEFLDTLQFVIKLYGDDAFRKWDTKRDDYTPKMDINLWDTIMQTIAKMGESDRNALTSATNTLREDLRDMVLHAPAFNPSRPTRKSLADRQADYLGRLVKITGGRISPPPPERVPPPTPRPRAGTPRSSTGRSVSPMPPRERATKTEHGTLSRVESNGRSNGTPRATTDFGTLGNGLGAKAEATASA